MKSAFAREIFKEEPIPVYVRQTESVKKMDFAESMSHHRPEAAAYIRLLHHTVRIFQSQMNLNQKKLQAERKLRRAEEEKKRKRLMA